MGHAGQTPPVSGVGYREGPAEIAAYVLTALALIGLGIWLTSIVLNWIIGPGLAIALVLIFTPLCRKAQGKLAATRAAGRSGVPETRGGEGS